MSRDAPTFATIDTGLFHDVKVMRLARRQRDGTRTAVSVMLYEATVLASWKANAPVPLEDAVPFWFIDDVSGHLADLVAAELLQQDGTVPADRLDDWMRHYRKSVAGGREGARRRWGTYKGADSPPSGEANADLSIYPSTSRARPREEPTVVASMKPFKEVMAEMGIKPEIAGKAKS